jgi:O-antigen ligase
MGMIVVLVARLHEIVPGLALLRPGLILTTVGFGSLWARSSLRRRSTALRDPTVRAVILLLLWSSCTIPFALWPGLAVESWQAVLLGSVLVTAMLLLPPTQKSVSRIVAALVTATGFYSVALLVWGKERVAERKELGAMLDPNDIATLLAMTFPFAIGFALRASGRIRTVAVLAAGLLVVGVTATGSRGGTIAIVVGSLVYGLSLPGSRKFLVILALIAGGAFAWRFAPPTYRARMEAVFRGEQDYNYTEYGGRKQIWARAVLYFAEHPFLGVGVGNFPTAEGEHLKALGIRGKWSAPHNAYVQAFVELGAPGGLIFLWLIFLTVRRAARYWSPSTAAAAGRPHRPELLASACAFAMGAVFLSLAYSYTLFALLGIVALSDPPAAGGRARVQGAAGFRGSPSRRSPVAGRGRMSSPPGPGTPSHGSPDSPPRVAG